MGDIPPPGPADFADFADLLIFYANRATSRQRKKERLLMKKTEQEVLAENVLYLTHAQIAMQMDVGEDDVNPIGGDGLVTITLTDGTIYLHASVLAYLPQGVALRHFIDDAQRSGFMARAGREFIPYHQIKSILEGKRDQLWKD